MKKIAITLMLLCCTTVFSTSAWALEQDTDGTYLIGTSEDWDGFATGISNGTIPVNANARLTADITVSTMIGANNKYAGIFDGQGHTITADISGTAGHESPFCRINGATIKNLTVAGTITGGIHCSGLVGAPDGTNTISNVTVSAIVTTTGSHCGGFVGHGQSSNTTIRDCLFCGTINGRSGGSTVGAIWGWSGGGTANIIHCLENGTYTNCSPFNPIAIQYGGTKNISRSFYVTPKNSGNEYGTLATAEMLANGHVAFYLQSGHEDLVWGQAIGTDAAPLLTSAETKRVYRAAEGGYTNDATKAADDQDVSPFLYTKGSNGKLTITCFDLGFTPPVGYALIIPEEIDGAPVTAIANNAFSGCTTVASVTIPATVTSMGVSVFSGCTALATATIADDSPMTTIPSGTFDGCTTLNNFTFPASIKAVDTYAFRNTTSLTNITFPATVTTLNQQAFYKSGLKAVTLPATITSMGTGVFQESEVETATVNCTTLKAQTFLNCRALESVTLANDVTTIGEMCFQGDTKLASVTLPEQLTVLPSNCFSGCTMLTSITVPESVTTIGASVFYQCSSLTKIDMSKCTKAEALYTMTTVGRTSSSSIFYGVPVTCEIILPPYCIATGDNVTVTKGEDDPTLADDGFYELSTAKQWEAFTYIVKGKPNANARMTADIDLGNSLAMVGSSTRHYGGTFDGQGYTLTINYDTKDMLNDAGQNYLGAAPFRDVEGATIRNLHTKGTITADKIGATGLIGWTYGNNVIERCWSEVDIIGTNSTADTFSGFVFRQDGTQLTINDCLYTGKIATVRKTSNAGFVGHHTAGVVNISNSLVVLAEGSDESQSSYFTFARNYYYNRPVNIVNSYYLRPWGVLQGTATTAEELADGTTATALAAGRDDAVWVQYDGRPMLLVFAPLSRDAEGNYLIRNTDTWKEFATGISNGTIEPTANAHMTADIDLGDDQTMIGTSSIPYQGTFDGQGHKLTINLTRNEDGVAPFRYVCGATIKRLHVDGSVNAEGKRCSAGIVGYAIGNETTTISECWASTIVKGYDTMGGIMAIALGNSIVNITDCIFTGTIFPSHSGEGCCGGFAAQAYKEGGTPTINITRGLFMGSYSGSTVRCYTFIRTDYPDLFGNHTITDCYYQNAYGTAQGTQATAEELANGTITAALQAGRAEVVWEQFNAMPLLSLFTSLTQGDNGYYQIRKADHLKEFAALVNSGAIDANAVLMNDIDLKGSDYNMWTPIGTTDNRYKGTFDGQGYTISNLYYKQQVENVGLFGSTNTQAYIKNVRVEGMIDITNPDGSNSGGKNCTAGGIVGNAVGGTILNCSFSGSVASYSHTGGIVGQAASGTTVVNCYNEGTVIDPSTSLQEMGGIIGAGSSTTQNCYNVGDVKNTATGSIIICPISQSTVINCYYRSGCCQSSKNGSWGNGSGGGTAMTADDMKAGAFVATLNTNVEALRANYPDISEWAFTSDGYPRLAIQKDSNLPDYIKGDANGDGQVTITDAVAVVNYILGNPSAGFVFQAADVNGDGNITITDAVGIVNIILNQ